MTLKLFITGDPGCGKTTLLRSVVERLDGAVRMRGFLTEERLSGGKRRGFQGRTLDGTAFLLADTQSSSTVRIGPYGVELEGLERIGVPALKPQPDTELVVLDEVGKMECFSDAFKHAVEELLAGPLPVLGTVAVHGVGFVKRLRHDPRVTLVRMRRTGREAALRDVLRDLHRAGLLPRAVGSSRSA